MTDIRNLLIGLNQRPIAVYPLYIDLAGSVKSGLLLSQIVACWRSSDERKFSKSDAELMGETGLSPNEFRSAKKKLKDLDFLKITREGMPAKTYYDIHAEGRV